MIPRAGRRPTFSDSGGMAVPPLESQVCRPNVTLGRPGTGSCLVKEQMNRGYCKAQDDLQAPCVLCHK
jgi:hypothetical protein